ncbi:hypothetical protein HAX54_014798 [Datura stramonium]|uniref:Transmembrane protein n=1 Tax=Datura stramonium TaxID=4076 RepID=A0ABS8TQJ4_DATST|nr:hypothetical protein [Datura stramonium]
MEEWVKQFEELSGSQVSYLYVSSMLMVCGFTDFSFFYMFEHRNCKACLFMKIYSCKFLCQDFTRRLRHFIILKNKEVMAFHSLRWIFLLMFSLSLYLVSLEWVWVVVVV